MNMIATGASKQNVAHEHRADLYMDSEDLTDTVKRVRTHLKALPDDSLRHSVIVTMTPASTSNRGTTHPFHADHRRKRTATSAHTSTMSPSNEHSADTPNTEGKSDAHDPSPALGRTPGPAPFGRLTTRQTTPGRQTTTRGMHT